MAETIPGGATYDMATNRWVDANGQPLSKEAAAEAQKLADQHAADLAEAERQARLLDATRDPTARAIAAALTGQTPGGGVQAPPAKPATPPAKAGT